MKADQVLDGLNEVEQRQLLDLLRWKFADAVELSADEREVWDALLEALKVRLPLAEFAKNFGKERMRQQLAAVDAFVIASCVPIMRKPVRMAVLRSLFLCLASHLASRGIPTTPKVMLSNVSLLSHAVEQRFPGYAQAKLLHRVAPLAKQ